MKSSDILRRTSTRRVSGSRLATSTSNKYASRICRSSSAFPGSWVGDQAHPPTSTPRRISVTPRHIRYGRAWRTTSGMRAPRLMAVVGAARRQDADAPRIAPDISNPLHLVRLRVDDVHRIIGRGGQIDLRA